MEKIQELLATDSERNGRTYYEVPPYQELRLAGTPWIVYHEGDEEQTATVDQAGELKVRGPHDWTVNNRRQVDVTDDYLTRRVSADLAVDRALTTVERQAIHQRRLTGANNGMEPADWIAAARECDAFLAETEPFMDAHGGKVAEELVTEYQLPQRLAWQISLCAVYAVIAYNEVTAVHIDQQRPIANRAALWARGYADATGWTPSGITGDVYQVLVEPISPPAVPPDRKIEDQ